MFLFRQHVAQQLGPAVVFSILLDWVVSGQGRPKEFGPESRSIFRRGGSGGVFSFFISLVFEPGQGDEFSISLSLLDR